jgi:hypothetical protein
VKLARPLTVCSLPGPDRKRTPTVYLYRVVYRAPDRHEPGCVMAWEVAGGRLPYQVALERLPAGGLAWHCSCADAVYRGDDPRHLCKHVRGVMDCLPATDGSGTSPAAGRR